jgi:hypothetical protein
MTVGDGRDFKPLARWRQFFLNFGFCGPPRPLVAGPLRTPVEWIADRMDERRARRLRFQLGRRRWLVSWQRQSDGRWLARLSCPSLVFTLERTGTTRTAAIARALRTLDVILSLRLLLNRGSLPIAQDAEQFTDPGW